MSSLKNLTIAQLWKLLAISVDRSKVLKCKLLQSEAKHKALLNEYYSQKQYYEHQLKDLRKEPVKTPYKQFIKYG